MNPGVFSVEKNPRETDLSQERGSFQVIGAAPELLFSHNMPASFAFVFFFFFARFFFFSKKPTFPVFSPEIHDIFQTGFNTTFCICHGNGDTEPEKLLLPCLCDRRAKALHNVTATIA